MPGLHQPPGGSGRRGPGGLRLRGGRSPAVRGAEVPQRPRRPALVGAGPGRARLPARPLRRGHVGADARPSAPAAGLRPSRAARPRRSRHPRRAPVGTCSVGPTVPARRPGGPGRAPASRRRSRRLPGTGSPPLAGGSWSSTTWSPPVPRCGPPLHEALEAAGAVHVVAVAATATSRPGQPPPAPMLGGPRRKGSAWRSA